MGDRVQSKFHDDANKRQFPPRPGKGSGQDGSQAGQDEQWAVLRHEVEDVDMRDRRGMQERAGWEQRDTDAERASPDDYYGIPDESLNSADIVVVGVGGGGMNAINRMIEARVRGVRYVALNTDAQVLSLSPAPTRICLGKHYTKGLGAGGNAAVGARAASESTEEIAAALGNADLVFIAAGMGGGTGTGGAPIVASLAKKMGSLTVGIVTLPFTFEGSRRKRVAEEGLKALGEAIDALITVPNDRLLASIGRDRSLNEAFKVADDVLRQGVQGIAEVINVPGLVNVDFADVRSVLREAGTALMSIGQGQGRNRAQRAAEEAVAGGFLNVSIRGAQRVLFNISGGEDMTLFEVNEVAEYIGNAIDTSADITFGAVVDPSLEDTIRVTLIAAGMQEARTVRIPAIHLENVRSQTASQPGMPAPRSPMPSTPMPQAQQGYSVPSPAPQADVQPQPAAQPRPAPQFQSQSGTGSASAGQPQQTARPSLYQGRTQRSLDDLRGLRSMGRRHKRMGDDDDDDDVGIDVPPFMKRHQ